jgi:hypothetical protein
MREYIENIVKKYTDWRIRRSMTNIAAFANANKRLLIIVADPRDNTLFMAHRGQQTGGIIKSEDGTDCNVVREVLKMSKFDKNSAIDKFIAALVFHMQAPLTNPHVNNFFQWVDGALFNINKAIKRIYG